MKKIITKDLIIIFFIGMIISIVMNFFFQIVGDINLFRENASEHFWQIEQILEEKEEDLAQKKEEFAEDCIIRARAAAYISQYYPEMIDDREECMKVASLLQVDELHFFTTEGEIYAGTHPEYYGYKFSSGEQMQFFEPLLTDHSLELCQDITPNTAEQKLMQYTAVWSKDDKRIVQVGLEPKRVLEAIADNNVADVFNMISTDTSSDFYAVDSTSGMIIGSTENGMEGKFAADIGLDTGKIAEESFWKFLTVNGEERYCVSKQTEDLILIKTTPREVLHKETVQDGMLLSLYFGLMFMVILIAAFVFIDRRILRNIVNINGKLKDIEQGKENILLDENGVTEFAELSRYINSMVGSLLDYNWKISKALEVSKVPIGICEFVPDTNRLVLTGRVKEILMLSNEEVREMNENPGNFENKKNQLLNEAVNVEDNIYCLNREEERYIKVESFACKTSLMTILIDVTAEVLEKQQIEEERDTDLLTDLSNRRAFFQRMKTLFAMPETLKTSLMVLVDLDNMKKVNDQWGHDSGDYYLMEFSRYLHACKALNKVAARIGGDEFILFLYGYEDETEIYPILEELRTLREGHTVKMKNGEEIPLEFSMGYVYYPREGTDYMKLIKLADQEMYKNKKARKGES